MKKSKIIIVLGAFIIITSILVNNPNKFQVKEKFNTPEKLISTFNNSLLLGYSQNINGEVTQTLYDTVSNRKRISDPNVRFNKIILKSEYKLSEKQKEEILKNYKNKANKMINYTLSEEVIPYRFKADGINYFNYFDGNSDYIQENSEPVTIDFVVIKENGSYVFDYIWIDFNSNEESKEAGEYDVRS